MFESRIKIHILANLSQILPLPYFITNTLLTQTLVFELVVIEGDIFGSKNTSSLPLSDISLKLTVRATVIALKLQISFCQDSW